MAKSSRPRKIRQTPEQRFWNKVQITESCWNWTGAITTTGYGVFQKGRRGCNLYKSHRFSYELHHGEIPDGMLILHSCDNKKCVNPNHLSIGDYKRNLKEAWDRGVRKYSEKQRIAFAAMNEKRSRLAEIKRQSKHKE